MQNADIFYAISAYVVNIVNGAIIPVDGGYLAEYQYYFCL